MLTVRQKKAAKMVGSSRSIKEAMIKADYAVSTASKKQQTLTKKPEWNELLEKYLPDDLIIAKHQQLLNATKLHGSPTEPDKVVDDNQTQAKMVELGYKVKKKLVDKWEGELTIPQPLLGGQSVNNDSNQEDTSVTKEN